MKLLELKTITPPDLNPHKTGKPTKANFQHMIPKGGVKLGDGGIQANAYTTPDEPGTVTKVIRSAENLSTDNYFKYVSALAKNDRIAKNPYFPKIYKVNVEQGNEGFSRYSVEMEALLEFETLSVEEMYMLGERMFFNFVPFVKDSRARLQDKLGIKDAKMTDYKTVMFAIMKAFETVIAYGSKVETYIKDPNLKGALLILKSLVKNQGANPDIHDGNIMVRRGPGGPHLVITDPVI